MVGGVLNDVGTDGMRERNRRNEKGKFILETLTGKGPLLDLGLDEVLKRT